MVEIRSLVESDWPTVAAIFEEGIATGDATFETEPPSWDAWDAAHSDIRLVAESDDGVVGWAALSGYSDRCCYRGVSEVSVYVADALRGRGVGRALLDALIASTEDAGIWTIQSGVFPENTASLALHQRAGFRVVGIR